MEGVEYDLPTPPVPASVVVGFNGLGRGRTLVGFISSASAALFSPLGMIKNWPGLPKCNRKRIHHPWSTKVNAKMTKNVTTALAMEAPKNKAYGIGRVHDEIGLFPVYGEMIVNPAYEEVPDQTRSTSKRQRPVTACGANTLGLSIEEEVFQIGTSPTLTAAQRSKER